MTQDEIVEMARQAGMMADGEWWFSSFYKIEQDVHISHLEAFAKLVAAKERKEICGTIQQIVPITSWAHELLEAIRARGEQA